MKIFPFFSFSGSHREIGRQYGEACSDLIKEHLDLAYERVLQHPKTTRAQIQEKALLYRSSVLGTATFLDEEVQGLAEACNLTLAEAYFLQLRAEVLKSFSSKKSKSLTRECTTFVALPDATANGYPVGGQNADLPGYYSEICIVIEIVCSDYPAVLMVVPAGQLSYIGINSSGLGVFGNYLVCDGWRTGFPRYFLTRLALSQDNLQDAERLLLSVERASSRNLLVLDQYGQAIDLEFAVRRHAKLLPENDIFVHSNHFLAPELGDEEDASVEELKNSRIRFKRLQDLLHEVRGTIDVPVMQRLLLDRETYPDTLCIEAGDYPGSDEMTVASLIAEPAQGQIWVAVGPPTQNPYHCYSFSNRKVS